MKTKAIICGVVVAAISTFVMSRAHAQVQDIPAVNVIPTDQTDVINVIYAYNTSSPVVIKFLNSEGLVYQEKLTGRDVERGFSQKFNIEKMKGDDLRVQIESQEFSVTFKLATSKNGKWSAQLEKVTHNFQVLALN
jgi:hypothetical protein